MIEARTRFNKHEIESLNNFLEQNICLCYNIVELNYLNWEVNYE